MAQTLIATHKQIQAALEQDHITRESLADVVQSIEELAKQPELILMGVIAELKAFESNQPSIYPQATIELLLLAWAIQFRFMSKRYAHLLLSQSIMSLLHSVHHKPKQPQSQLIRCAHVLASEQWQEKPLATTLARLVRYRNVEQGTNLLAEVLWYQQQFLETNTDHHLRPLPRKLLSAIRSWPYNDDLFEKVLSALETQHVLSHRVREHATAQTNQHRLLSLKESLLLLGPEQSREVILVTHFATHLTWPYMPLRLELLMRRVVLADMLRRLASHCRIELPCDAELLSYLWIYDAWYHSELSTQQQWQYETQTFAPERVGEWQSLKTKLTSQRALKLAEYWQLPATTLPLLRMHKSESNRAILCARLAHIAAALICEHALNAPKTWQARIETLQKALQLSSQDFQKLLQASAFEQSVQCPIQVLPL